MCLFHALHFRPLRKRIARAQSGSVKADAAAVLDINSDDDNVGSTSESLQIVPVLPSYRRNLDHPSHTHSQSKGSHFAAEIIDLSD